MKTARADRGQVTNFCLSGVHENGGVLFVYYFLWLGKFVKFVVN
jgi:hypothetical protein